MIIYAIYGCLSMAAAIFGRLRPFGLAFFLFALWFVALRFETGFDWPIYKGLFNEMRGSFDPFSLSRYGHLYNGEPAFLLLLGAMSWFFPTYEWAQFAFSAFFFLSLWALGKTFAKDGMFVFLAVALSYIVLTVGFSTVRQSIAISLFGFALVMYIKNSRGFSVVLMCAAVIFQYSAAIYVVGFLAFLLSGKYDRSRFAVPTFFMILVPIAVFSFVLLFFAQTGSYSFDVRLYYYLKGINSYRLSLWDLFHLLVFVGMATHAMLAPFKGEDASREQLIIWRMLIVFSAIAISTLLIPIVRERVSYELWILYALFLTHDRVVLRQMAVVCTVGIGLAYNAYALLRPPNGPMFVPYQNLVLPEAHVERPYEEFMHQHNVLMSGT